MGLGGPKSLEEAQPNGGLKFLTLLRGQQQGFFYWGDRRNPSPTGQIFTHPSPTRKSPTSRLPSPKAHSPTKKQFSFYNPMKTSFITVVIAPVLFYFTYILFVHTGHTNSDFNQCSVFTECFFFSFEKNLSGQNHSLSDSQDPIEKFPPRQIFYPPLPPSTIWKTLEKGPSLFKFFQLYSNLNSTFLMKIYFFRVVS